MGCSCRGLILTFFEAVLSPIFSSHVASSSKLKPSNSHFRSRLKSSKPNGFLRLLSKKIHKAQLHMTMIQWIEE
ncbi:hypothetical protein L1987_76624 [Smallanthus sonchifolius]|uniref:Uncharacterized protein n=1 Tax=Smallanthus sonchifolius TaxID=185202 RepID=A0ACB8Z8S3_9ASTR|nr:hypothetical protein L1987_76624 [Smallanthus sonchifolius]